MANKNHELDKPIIEAAKQEFLKNGFQETSINIIAQKAGVTTGAIYTRYKGKDELFGSLMEDFFKSINDTRLKNKSSYMNYYTDKNFNNFIYLKVLTFILLIIVTSKIVKIAQKKNNIKNKKAKISINPPCY